MPQSPDDPFRDEGPVPAAPKTTRIRVDWTRGARLLGRGESPDAVAAALGIDEERLWRHLKASRRFQRLLNETLGMRRLTADPRQGARQAGNTPE